MLLALKLVLVPGLVVAVTLGARRWGPRIGGWLTALPLVAGPTLFFLALEQGHAFAARAALSTLAGLIGVCTFGVARVLPAERGHPAPLAPPAWDLPLRMAGALAVVLTVTSLADRRSSVSSSRSRWCRSGRARRSCWRSPSRWRCTGSSCGE